MCVAAHPDDEDGTTLTVLRRKYGVHTVSLFSTYGEGGQNAVGPELYEQLGVIRAEETRKAAEIQGSEPYFLGLKDFGFSKSADEAFRIWGHDEALRRMVQKIRELRPDVVITNHDTTSGHGHHQATGRLIIEAFDAAADPQRFPEQLPQASTWQIKRLYVRARRTPNTTAQPSPSPAPVERIVTIDPNEVDPLRGTSYGAQALSALQQHATQGPWPKSVSDWLRAQNNQTGKLNPIRYRLIKEAGGTPPLAENAATVFAGLESSSAKSTLPTVDGKSLIESIDQPDKLLDALIDWRVSQSTTASAAAGNGITVPTPARVSKVLAIAAGISMAVHSSAPVLVPNKPETFSVVLANQGDRGVRIRSIRLRSFGETVPVETADLLLPDTETTVSVTRTTPASATFTVPKDEHLYDGGLLGQTVNVEADLEVEGAKFALKAETNLDVAPALEIKQIEPVPFVVTSETLGRPWLLDLTITNHGEKAFKGRPMVKSPGEVLYEVPKEITLGTGETFSGQLWFNSIPPAREAAYHGRRSGQAELSLTTTNSKQTIAKRVFDAYYINAAVAPNLNVGYIPSVDQTLSRALRALNVKATELTVATVQTDDLSKFSTIIVDNRGYELHPGLIAVNSRLLQYVQDGGTLLVFYHKDNEWNPDEKRNRPQLAPYPIILNDDRITDENAPIKFLHPGHPLLNYPNKIGARDFEYWIQERGLYYPKEWDAKYTALFVSNDPGEKPLRGGLLVAKYGKGNYIYTSMVWYRQLRAGVPGGYRMFANLLSYK
jgi:LmbE family N-acetylglucosaminyl deacetylase